MTKLAIIGLVSIFTINVYPGFILNLYQYPIFGITLHFLGGFFVSMLLSSFYKNDLERLPRFLKIITIIGITIAVGVLWEFTEYSANKLFSPIIYSKFGVHVFFMGDLDDTITDLFMDTLGALVFALHFIRRSNSKKF